MLSQNNNNHFKHLCRSIIKGLDVFKDLKFAYDGCGLLWTPKALEEDLQLSFAQNDLDAYLKQFLVDPLGILHVSVKNGVTIMTSDFTNTVNSKLVEDRSWRNMMEMVLSEDAITRDRKCYVPLGPGCLVETAEHPFQCGLVYRNGNTKGVHIIKGKNGAAQMALAMDCCSKVFYPANMNFSKFLQCFMESGKTYDEAEILCWGLRLRNIHIPCKICRFKSFDNIQDGQLCAIMNYTDEVFPVGDLEIVSDQTVPLDSMPQYLKNQALELNCFKPHLRKQMINDQLRNLQLNNEITAAFGIYIEEQMLDGTFDEPLSMPILVKNDEVIVPDENGAFKLDCRNYYRRGNFQKFVLFATKIDRDRAIESIKKIVKFATNKSDREVNAMIQFHEFDTTSKLLNPWVNALNQFKGNGNLVITVDETPDSHSFLKFAEAITGVNTQHIKLSTASDVRFQTCQNIVHKLNIKMGGLNHVIKLSKNVKNLDLNSGKVFVLGLDVCHPTGDNYKGQTDEPSFGGLVGNYLKHPQEFGDLFFAQTTRKELVDKRPLIHFIEKMLVAVKQFRKIETIALIRDGVSEGQYTKVLEDEVEAIRKAAKNVSLNVKIVVFIVTKNGNVRHFYEAGNGRVESMPPRSFINFGTRYNFHQFYMTAHRSFQGTAKTIMITKIHDDFKSPSNQIGISLAESQEFLLGLTYLHQIVSLPISLPTPVNQADAIAQRGQNLYRTMLKYCPTKIPRTSDGSVVNQQLTEILSINNSNLPTSRYAA